MVTMTGTASRFRFAAALAAALGVHRGGRAADASDLSATLSPQDGNGNISYAGGSGDLVGKNLGVESITGLSTPLHGPSTTLKVVNGMLGFNTGAFTGGDASGAQWNFASGGNLSLQGTIPSIGINTDSVLLTGSFSDPTTVRSLNGSLKVQGGAFFSIVNPTLASYFGLPTGVVLYSGGLSTLFRADGTSPSAFTSNGFTGGTLTVAPVPEPGTLVVFGALAAFGFVRLRRKAACPWSKGSGRK